VSITCDCASASGPSYGCVKLPCVTLQTSHAATQSISATHIHSSALSFTLLPLPFINTTVAPSCRLPLPRTYNHNHRCSPITRPTHTAPALQSYYLWAPSLQLKTTTPIYTPHKNHTINMFATKRLQKVCPPRDLALCARLYVHRILLTNIYS
jgi:hypothetical protein